MAEPDQPTIPAPEREPGGLSWRDEVRPAIGRLARAAWIGAAVGLVVGGIGGRVAMFVLRLTSDPSLRGKETDDGFAIGRISADTFFLLAFTVVIGIGAGLVYLAVRRWLPTPRPLSAAVLGGVAGGSAIVDPKGIDFTLLEPRVLAVVMFIAIPAAAGAADAWLVDRGLHNPARVPTVVVAVAIAPILLVGFVGIQGLVFLLALLGWLLLRLWPPFATVWQSPAVTIAGRVLLGVIAVLLGWVLAGDIVRIL